MQCWRIMDSAFKIPFRCDTVDEKKSWKSIPQKYAERCTRHNQHDLKLRCTIVVTDKIFLKFSVHFICYICHFIFNEKAKNSTSLCQLSYWLFAKKIERHSFTEKEIKIISVDFLFLKGNVLTLRQLHAQVHFDRELAWHRWTATRWPGDRFPVATV